MANIIERIVRLTFDKSSAKDVEAGVRQMAGDVDGTLSRLGRTAKAFATVLATAFSIKAISAFAARSVDAAKRLESAWSSLGGTVRNAGGSFGELQGRISATADAFSDATAHGTAAYLTGLDRMITLTGDVEASLANMGLAANVAAQFFGGDLTQAVEMVSRVANGNVTQLRRMGIEVKSAQEGLEVLAQRSLGAASRQMETFDGQVKGLTSSYGDLLEAVGAAIISGDRQANIVGVLQSAIEGLTAWVRRNDQALASWVANGIKAAIWAFRQVGQVVDAVIRTIAGFGELLAGPVIAAAGAAVSALGKLASGLVLLGDIWTKVASTLGMKGVSGTIAGLTDKLRDQVAAMKTWGAEMQRAGGAVARSGFGRFGKTMLDWSGDASPPTSGDLGPINPMVSRNAPAAGVSGKAAAEDVDKVAEALQRYRDAVDRAAAMSQLLGDAFDRNQAEAQALARVISDLLDAGLDASDERLQQYAASLLALAPVSDNVAERLQQLADEMRVIDGQAVLFGDAFDAAAAKASALESAITDLLREGLEPSDPVLQAYIEQWHQLTDVLGEVGEQAQDTSLAVSNLASLIAGSIGGELASVASAKAKQNLLLAAEQTAAGVVAMLNPFTAASAAGHFTAAAKYGAIAAGWAALGKTAGGGGGGELAAARGSSAAASQSAQQPGPDVTIYLTGDMNALDPRVQKWVYAAQEQYAERGGNARVRVMRTTA